ncbi:hypothetical protein C9374_013884 [Naegleria lovaniensis]|uniref:CSC1/OSCA1-like cytosolic domain-containing protein n=1 Tax=Naegleria lovaniensis TaxID=51637 RepID=A0AA88H0J2_NAELO|nr:uncharacterized protein C9374_013884 [Naegleria lovaniensis]KAG2389324.1 hypothetical protein C9374_013884 [Naegleria lovaniensis]
MSPPEPSVIFLLKVFRLICKQCDEIATKSSNYSFGNELLVYLHNDIHRTKRFIDCCEKGYFHHVQGLQICGGQELCQLSKDMNMIDIDFNHKSDECGINHHGIEQKDQYLNCFPSLQKLVLNKRYVDHDIVTRMMNCPNLKLITHLNLALSRVQDETVHLMTSSPLFSNLTCLNLSTTSIGVESVKSICNSVYMSNLKDLQFDWCNIGDAVVYEISQSTMLKKLTSLNLTGNKISFKAVKDIGMSAVFNNLTCLMLDFNNIGVEGIEYLVSCENLSNLEEFTFYFNAQDISTPSLVFTVLNGTMTKLNSIKFTPHSDTDVERFITCKNIASLKTLELCYHRHLLYQGGLDLISNCPNLAKLETLILQNIYSQMTNITSLINSPYIKKLTALTVTGIGLTSSDLLELSKAFPMLKKLVISDQTLISIDSVVESLSHLKRLESLEMRGIDFVSCEKVEQFASHSNASNLSHLCFTHKRGFIPHFFGEFSKLENLRHLNIRGTELNLEDAKALACTPKLARLTKLFLPAFPGSKSKNLKKQVIEILKQSPYLRKRFYSVKDGTAMLLLLMVLLIVVESSSPIMAKVMKTKIQIHQDVHKTEFSNFVDTSCLNCVGNKKVWCALEQFCASSLDECRSRQPFNVTCARLPLFRVEILRSSEKVLRNFVVPMTQQPIIGLLSSKEDPFQYVYDLYDSSKRNFAVGAFYVSTLQSRSDGRPEISKKPGLFFSYNFHTDHKPLIKYQDGDSNTEQSSNQYRLIKFADISTAVQEPNRYYRIGYSVIRRIANTNDTSKSTSYSYQCSFNTTSYDVYIDPDYKFSFSGPHVFVGLPLVILSIIILSIPSLCCVNKFAITKHNRGLLLADEAEEHYYDDIHAEFSAIGKEKEEYKKKKKEYEDFLIYKHRRNFFGETPFKKSINTRETNSFTNDEEVDDEEKFTDLKSRLQHASRFYNPLIILKSIFFATDTQLVQQCGTDVYYYLWFSKYLIIYLLVCGVIACGFLLPTYLTTTDNNVSFGDFSSTTIAQMNIKQNDKIYVFFLVTISFPIIGLVFIYGLHRLSRQLIKSRNNIGSLYTVMVNGVSKNIRDRRRILEDFKRRYGENNVVDAHIALDLNELSALDEKKEEIEVLLRGAEKQYEKTSRRPTIKIRGFLGILGSKVDAIDHYTKALDEINKNINDLRTNPSRTVHGTGYAFVTFSSMEAAQKCLNEHRDIPCCCGFSIPWWCCIPSGWPYGGIERAPESDDILFENLNVSSTNRWFRSLTSSSIITIVLLIIYSISTTVSWYYWYKGQNISQIKDYAVPSDSIIGVDTAALILMALADLLPEVISLANELVKPIIEVLTDFERHPSRTSRRKTVLTKSIFFICLSIAAFPFFVRWVKAVWGVAMNAYFPFNNYAYFFNYIGTEVATLIMALCSIAKTLEYTFIFIVMMIKYRFNDNGNGRKELERLPFDYDANIGVKTSIMMLTLIYGSAVPLMFLFGLFYLIVTYYMDKYLIMYFYEKAPDSDGTIMRITADQLVYYLSVYPILLIFMIPTLATLWSTWLIYLPTMFLFYLIVRFARSRMSKAEMDMLVVSLNSTAHIQDEDILTSQDTLEMEVTDTNGSPSSPIPSGGGYTSPSASTTKVTSTFSSIMSFVAGEEQVLSIYDKEIEKRLEVDQRFIASRYRHPYLRKDKRKSQQRVRTNKVE